MAMVKLPHTNYKVRQLLEAGEYGEAQAACDENVEWLRDQIATQQDMFLEIECRKRGIEPTPSNKNKASLSVGNRLFSRTARQAG